MTTLTSPPWNGGWGDGHELEAGPHFTPHGNTNHQESQANPTQCLLLQSVCSPEGIFWLGHGEQAVWPQGCREDTGCDNPQAPVQRIHGPEDSSATLRGEWEWGSGMVQITVPAVIQISKRIQLVKIYKRQQLRVCAFTFPSARSEFTSCLCDKVRCLLWVRLSVTVPTLQGCCDDEGACERPSSLSPVLTVGT